MRYLVFILLMLTTEASGQVIANRNSYFGIGISGDSADVVTPAQFGVVLMGGSTDVDEALQWMIQLSGGGDFVILRASGSTGYNDYIKGLGNINSVETLMLDSREKAMTKEVGQRIRQAEAVFIAGGDQWNYVNYWSNSEVSSALHYLIHEKKVPIGGTSAGCAVLSGICFDARHDTSVSVDALANPFHLTVSLSKSFIEIPFLENTVADQHYSKRDRLGRHVVFMSRMVHEQKIVNARGIGVDEKTAVCVDDKGQASVYGKGSAFFLIAQSIPEACKEGQPLEWNNNGKAIRAYVINGSTNGTKAFNLNQWPTEKPTQFWSVKAGVLTLTNAE
jgi:cyanophycinase